MDVCICSVVVSAALLEITWIILFCLHIFVHIIDIVSVATKDTGKDPGKITNIFTLIWGAIRDAIPRIIEYSKPEARFRRVRPCTSSAKQYQNWPKRPLGHKGSKMIENDPGTALEPCIGQMVNALIRIYAPLPSLSPRILQFLQISPFKAQNKYPNPNVGIGWFPNALLFNSKTITRPPKSGSDK